MKKFLMLFTVIVAGIFVLAACSNDADVNDTTADNGVEIATPDIELDVDVTDTDPLNVLVTFSIIADMVENVGGHLVNVTTIVPIGEEPEEYEFTPGDVMNAIAADVIFHNGLDLEHEYDWFEELMATADRIEDVDFFAVNDESNAVRLLTEDLQDYYDPHTWMDPILGMEMVNTIADVLAGFMPEYADVFAANAQNFNAKIYAVYTEWAGRFDQFSDMSLVTTEGAFRYFGYRFNITTEFIWEFNSEDEGTPEQFIRVIDIVNAGNVPFLFIESSVDPDYMEQVSEETGVPIFDEYLFTDSLSEVGGPAATYLAFLRHNLQTVYTAFAAE